MNAARRMLATLMLPWAAIIAALNAINPVISAAAVSGAFMLANTGLVWWLTRVRRRDEAENGTK